MSYILEALKKAERERELGRVPGIGSPHETPPPRPPRRWPWVLAGVLLLNALVVAGLWWRGLQGSGDGIAPTSTPAAQLEQEIQAPVVEPRGEPENAGVPAADPVLPPPVPARRPLRPLPLPEPLPVPPSPPSGSALAEEPPRPAPDPLPALPLPDPSPAPTPVSAAPSPPTRPDPVESATAGNPPAQSEPAWKSLPVWPRVPDGIYRQVQGRLAVNAHVYHEQPAGRFVLLNMKKYREGERIVEGPYLEEITREGVVLAVPGGRFRLKAR